MQHLSIATFAAVLFFAAVYCSPTTPNKEPSAVHPSELEHPKSVAHGVEDASRQKRQFFGLGFGFGYPYYRGYPGFLYRKRRDVNSVNANEEPATVNAPEGSEGPEEQRAKRQLLLGLGYPAFAPAITYSRFYSPFPYFI